MDVLLFGDQTVDQYHLLRKTLARKDNALLTTFLERSAVALREEIRRLPKSRREEMPDFLTVSNMLENYSEKGLKVPEMESVLVAISQLSHYLGYVELKI